ncbi:hypothetical protein AVEN_106383-1 [Araneus ventricosus]|uniref:MATH domain-containing protein n=1 Tax=Araneus ventricosus TaxID=182803 RepID=A0A4Y2AUK5_ARAVE|nr:hypothetical protein AVEN_106383-1 [Araneus ventricosus]
MLSTSATAMGTLLSIAVTFLSWWLYGVHSFEKESLKFDWLVENYPYCRQKACEPLSSPVFNVGESAWHLRLDSRLEADGNHYFALFLVREMEDRGPDTMEVEFEASIFNPPPLSPEAQKSGTYSFRRGNGYGWPKFVNRREIWSRDKDDPFAPGSPLVVTSTLKVSKSLFPFKQGYVAITRIENSVLSFTWTVERFSALLPGEMKTIRIKPALPDGQLMSLAIFVTDAVPSEVKIQIQVIQRNKQVKCSACKVSLLDANEKHWISFNDTFVGNTLWEFPLFLTKDKLMVEKKQYLPNDELSLNFHCVVSTGTENERIVAWHSGTLRST